MSEPPSILYRYRGYTKDDLSNDDRRLRISSEIAAALRGEVWFSHLASQNDPFDTNPYYVSSPEWQVQKLLKHFHGEYGPLASFSGVDFRHEARDRGISTKGLKSTKKKHSVKLARKAAQMMIEEHPRSQAICCFSESGSDLLMWSYYSASHSSYCFRFSYANHGHAEARMKIGQVSYVAERPTISTTDILSVVITGRRPNANFVDPSSHERFTNAFILTKSIHWEHERVWRSLQEYKRPPGYYSIHPYRLTGVIFGCKATLELQDFVTERLGGAIEVIHARTSRKRFALNLS